MENKSLAQFLLKQDGVITLQQAYSCGLTDSAVRWKVSTGQWRRVGTGIFHLAGERFTAAARLHAAVLAAGEGAAAWGPSAAWWLGLLPAPPLVPWVNIPTDRLVRRKEPMIVRRRDVDPRDRARVNGLSITAQELTILETAVEIRDGSVFLDQMLINRVSLDRLAATHARNVGRRGSTDAGMLLTVAMNGGRKDARRRLLRLLADTPGWDGPVTVAGCEFDVAFAAERIAVEVSGWACADGAHPDSSFRRDNLLIGSGWSVLHFDWHRLHNDPSGVVSEIRGALQTRQRQEAQL